MCSPDAIVFEVSFISCLLTQDTELQLLKEKVQEISRKLESGEAQLQACSKRKVQLEGDFVEAQQNHEFAQKYTSMLVEDKWIFQQKLEQREKQIEHLQSEQLEYERIIRSLEVKLAGASANLEAQQKLKDKLKRLKEQKENLIGLIESNQTEIDRLCEKKNKLKQKLDESAEEMSGAESRLKLKNEELFQAKEELKHLKEENDKLLEQLRKQEKDTDAAIVSHSMSQPGMEECPQYENLKVSRWVGEMEEMDKAMLEKEVHIQKLEREDTYINTSKAGLRAELEGMEKELQKLKRKEQDQHEGPLPKLSTAALDSGKMHHHAEEDKLEVIHVKAM